MSTISYVGIKSLTTSEAEIVKMLLTRHIDKLERYVKNFTCRVHIKLYETEGNVKYSFHTKVSKGSTLLNADATDWNMRKALHKSMRKLHTEAERVFRKKGQAQERFHPPRVKRGTDARLRRRY